jgi:UDP-N-acetylglucosamine 2-epimerase (non-hydrolysing)
MDLEERGYALVTLYRPSNVDDPETLRGILEALADVAALLPVLFPAHPRTVKMLQTLGLSDMVSIGGAPAAGTVSCIEPVGYVDFLRLMMGARLVLTDSGGIQEETTILGVPCLTLRWNTERPITVTMGTNTLVGTDPDAIRSVARAALEAPMPSPSRPPLWDGKAAERIAEAIADWKSLS